ncbi:hypothetical protein O181_008000 [Austropuccinia psidii MF-1]|uniref:Uncharacterized protein n=1 Tax=Austropuccinia psidii MF-1 TaxID=1389203 RepID=A0A9Q3BP37_9BASI|nr:hypothetical protein [Austropuccinia psidii MF-1]
MPRRAIFTTGFQTPDVQIPHLIRFYIGDRPRLPPYIRSEPRPLSMFRPFTSNTNWLCGALNADFWPLADNKMIHSASMIFPRFQTAKIANAPLSKGLLPHVLNAMMLREVPTKVIFRREKEVIISPFSKRYINPGTPWTSHVGNKPVLRSSSRCKSGRCGM